jgi:polysaccharide pyruvyl transferase WcaK-like protein
MKTFTVTYHHTHNYGALLQTYALQHTIESMGHSNLVFEYPYDKTKKAKVITRSPKDTVRNLYLRYLNVLRKKETKRLDSYFVDFHKNHLKVSREYVSMEDLINNPPDADCLISGSDQVWNLNTLPEFIPARFLAFGDEKAKRISYAASIEGLNYSEAQKEMVRNYLTKFDAISLREQSAKEYIEGFSSITAQRVLDPVFLLTPDEWRKISKQPRITGNYILCYQVQRNPRMQTVVDNLKEKTGYRIVSVCNSSIKWIKSDLTLYDVSPEEFIGLYDGASIVVSASFHGTALGVLFGKPTYGLVKKTRGNRIRELLELFGLESFCLSEDSTIPDPKYDTKKVKDVLDNEREKSLRFLRESIEND